MVMEQTEPGSIQLRQQAEAGFACTHISKQTPPSAETLLHELRMRQVELEIQNEQLRKSQAELEKSRDRFVDFYDFAPVGYLTLNQHGMIEEINLTGAALLNVERNKLPYYRFASYVALEDRDCWHRHFLSALQDDKPLSCELVLQRDNGPHFHAQLDCLSLKKEGREPLVRLALTDITERKHAEEAVRAQEEFFRMIVENVDDFLAVLDLDGRRLYNSPSYVKLFGGVEAMKDTDSFAEVHPGDVEHIKQAFKETVQSGNSHRLNYRFMLPDGSTHFMESCGALIRNSQGQPLRVVVVSRDITERLKEDGEIRDLAFYDALTHLPSRHLLNDRLDHAMAASKRSGRHGALMLLDLDGFTPINDTYGHGVGNRLLMEVARRLTNCVREMDTVARIGSDEFVVLLSELDVDKAKSALLSTKVAEKIRASLAEPYMLKGRQEDVEGAAMEHRCSACIGVVLFVDRVASSEEIVKWADVAMHQAKEAGGNLIRFYDAEI